MRIGFDGSCLANRRGFGRFARQTLAALGRTESRHEYVVFVDRPSHDLVSLPPGFERVVVDVSEAPSRAASSTGRRSLADMLAMGRAVARARLDLIYFPATYSFFPVWGVRRVVVTMHDTLALAHPALVFPNWKGRLAWMLKEHVAARAAHRIMTVSETARRDLLAWFRLPGHRVHVMTEGPEEMFGPRPVGPSSDAALQRAGVTPGEPFLLYVGGLSPHKNLPRLIDAFAGSGLAGKGYRLVLVGDLGDVFHTHIPVLREHISTNQLDDRVVFTGYVPDEDLVYLYNRAVALVQPSLMEGFGLPPVEAMACGTAVVASHAGSLPEVVGDAGLFFDPLDVQAMSEALCTVVEDSELRAAMQARSLQRSQRYTWEAAAQTLLDTFDELDPDRDAEDLSRDSAPGWRKSA